MEQDKQNKNILILSFLLAALIIFVSSFGLLSKQIYSRETLNWTVQAVAQDSIDLFILTPLLLLSSFYIYNRNKIALLIWSGILLYLIYTFIIYCFAVHFNSLFLFYCLTLGLSFYLFMYFLISQIRDPVVNDYTVKIPVKTIGIYIITIACLFFLLWLSEIMPPMLKNSVPKEIVEIGLPVNPIFSIDLSICLPGFFITGFLLLKKTQLGLLLTPAILVFTILMDITISTLNIFMKLKGLETNLSISIVMVLFAAISVILLVKFLKSLQIK